MAIVSKLLKKHVRSGANVIMIVVSGIQLTIVASAYAQHHIVAQFEHYYIVLITISGTMTLLSALVGMLNFLHHSWFRYQVLFECIWVIVTFFLNLAGFVLSVFLETRSGCKTLQSFDNMICGSNMTFIYLDCVNLLCNAVQAVLLLHFLRRAKMFSERSVKSIILTDTRAMPHITPPAPAYSKRSTIYTLPHKNGESFIDLEFGFKVPEYGPIPSRKLKKPYPGHLHAAKSYTSLVNDISAQTLADTGNVAITPPRGALTARHRERRARTLKKTRPVKA